MNEVVHADIFFFIASIATIVLAVVIGVGGYYVVMILRDIRDIVAKVNKASDELERDFEDFRNSVRSEGIKVRTLLDMLLGFLTLRLKKRVPSRKQKPPTESEKN